MNSIGNYTKVYKSDFLNGIHSVEYFTWSQRLKNIKFKRWYNGHF